MAARSTSCGSRVRGDRLAGDALPAARARSEVEDGDAQRWAGLIAANFISSALMAPVTGVWATMAQEDGPAPFWAFRGHWPDGARCTPQQLALRLLQGAVGGFVAASLPSSPAHAKAPGYALGLLQASSTAGRGRAALRRHPGRSLRLRAGLLITGACVWPGLSSPSLSRSLPRG